MQLSAMEASHGRLTLPSAAGTSLALGAGALALAILAPPVLGKFLPLRKLFLKLLAVGTLVSHCPPFWI